MSITQRPNGRYAVQVYDPQIGRMRQIGTYDTKKTARKAEQDAIARDLAHGTTVGAFADRWLTDFPRNKPSSNHTHAYRIKTFVAKYSARRMDSITVLEARRWALEHRTSLPSPRAMWNDARRAGIVTQNPFEKLGIEQSRGRKDLPAGWLTLAQVHELRDIALHRAGLHPDWAPVFAGAIMIAAYTGIRPGELFTLRHGDLGVDEIEIQRGADSHTQTVGTPKNSYARTIVYPAEARDAVASIERYRDLDLVIYSPRGKQFWSTTFGRYWDKVRNAAGRPDMDFYELRHFCATYLLELGVSHSDVAVQLGHRDGGKLIMSTYGHPSEIAARKRIKAAFDGATVGDLAKRRNTGRAS